MRTHGDVSCAAGRAGRGDDWRSVVTHTKEPWAVGAQNDALFITAGRSPAQDNDYPWHDAPRVALGKLYGETEGDCLPINALGNGRRIVDCVNALAGIPNPTAFVNAAKGMAEAAALLWRMRVNGESFCDADIDDAAERLGNALTAYRQATGEE
jgi:hypothetical protein